MANRGNNPIKVILIIIILIAFICGLALGVSAILGDDSDSDGDVEYVNVTNNITEYVNSSDVIETENGTYVPSSQFEVNVTEGDNLTGYNNSASGNLY